MVDLTKTLQNKQNANDVKEKEAAAPETKNNVEQNERPAGRIFDPWATLSMHSRADVSRLLLDPGIGGIDPAKHQQVFNFCAGIYAKMMQEGLAPTIAIMKELGELKVPDDLEPLELYEKLDDLIKRAAAELHTPTQQ